MLILQILEKKLNFSHTLLYSLVFGCPLLSLNDILHFFSLSFGSGVTSKSFFAEFQGSFVLTDSKQLDASSFVCGVSNYLSNDVVNKCGFFGFHTFVSALRIFVAG